MTDKLDPLKDRVSRVRDAEVAYVDALDDSANARALLLSRIIEIVRPVLPELMERHGDLISDLRLASDRRRCTYLFVREDGALLLCSNDGGVIVDASAAVAAFNHYVVDRAIEKLISELDRVLRSRKSKATEKIKATTARMRAVRVLLEP